MLLSLLFFFTGNISSQILPPCDWPGFTPGKPFLICGTKAHIQEPVTPCDGGLLVIPKFCRGTFGVTTDTAYRIYSPLYFKFKCYKSGTLGFIITPITNLLDDFDWQLYDITGKNPEDHIYFDASLIVTGFWINTGRLKGAKPGGIPYFGCSPLIPTGVYPSQYGEMPSLIEGHEYLLLVARTEDFTGGFRLDFTGGTADITDPLKPKLLSAKPECSGKEITVKINKELMCESLSPDGSQFRILPAGPAFTWAAPIGCESSNGFLEVKLTLSSPLTDGNYELTIVKGSDRKILRDVCDNNFLPTEKIPFEFIVPKPILADSVGNPDCTPDSIKLYYPKKINCSSISANGSDFSISGPQAVNVQSASGSCKNGKTDYVIIKFDQRITVKGNYQLTIKAGDDGSVLVDECGEESPEQTLAFQVADTVNAEFIYANRMGCRQDTLTFSHNGAHDVNKWTWKFNDKLVFTQNPSIIWPAKSNNQVELIVSNSGCKDTATIDIALDNEVKAVFDMPSFICPEDKLQVINKTEGIVDAWRWNFDIASASNLKDPPPFLMPSYSREAYYTVKLVAYNNSIPCRDSATKTLTVLDNCSGSVPTAFTPNNDGLNDFFWPHNALKGDNYEFKVFNRMGQIVFQTRNWQSKWDGRVKGELQTTGVYVWMVRYTNRDTGKTIFQKGTVTLIR